MATWAMSILPQTPVEPRRSAGVVRLKADGSE
jgi:hypothetical protein